MRRRSIFTAFGIVVLVAIQFLSDPYPMLARGGALLALGFLAIEHLFARVPVKYWVWLLRLCVLALSGWLLKLSADAAADIKNIFGFYAYGLGVLACFSLAVGPSLSLPFRRKLYLATLLLAWLDTLALFVTEPGPGFEGLVVPFGLLAAVTWIYRRWCKTKSSLLVEMLTRWQRDARTFWSRFEAAPTRTNTLRERWQSQRLASRLLTMSESVLRTRTGYENLLATCRKHPNTPLAWQIAYTVCISKRDFDEAAKVVAEAQSYGYEAVLGDRALAVALRGTYDPAWRRILNKGREDAVLGGADAFSWGVDPTIVWRERDANFARIYQHFAVTGVVNSSEAVRI